jgi:hypothetical protein
VSERFCDDRGKVKYATKSAALAARRGLSRRHSFAEQAYHCATCGAWHLGRQKTTAQRKRFKGLPA